MTVTVVVTVVVVVYEVKRRLSGETSVHIRLTVRQGGTLRGSSARSRSRSRSRPDWSLTVAAEFAPGVVGSTSLLVFAGIHDLPVVVQLLPCCY